MRFKTMILAALTTISCCGAALADSTQPASPNPSSTAPNATPTTTAAVTEPQLSAEKRALIMDLLSVTQANRRVDAVVAQMMAAHQKQYPMMIAQIVNSNPDLTDAQKREVIEKAKNDSQRSSERLRELFVQKINLGDVMDKVALVVYDKNFTESELKDLIAFYKTPTGQKALKQLPEVLKESMEMTSQLIAPQMGQIIAQLMDEERARLKAAGASTAPAK